MKALVIFDLDGTLLDTLSDLAGSTNCALKMFNFPERSIDEVRSFVGNGIGKLIERAVPDGTDEATVADVLAAFREHYAAHCEDTTAAYPHIIEMLNSLRSSGVKTAVVSNKADFAVQKLCHKYFDGLFDMAVGELGGVPKKPAPDSIYNILNTLGISKEDAVYVGDSDVDIDTARNAGIESIIVSWGFRDKAFLKEHGATCIVDTPEEIIRCYYLR